VVAEINLLPKKEKKALSGKMYIIVLIGIFIVISLFFVYLFFASKAERTQVNAELNQMQADVVTLQSEVDGMSTIESDSRQSAVHFTESVSYPVSPIILEVDSFLPLHTYLRDYEFEEQSVSFQVDFEDKTMIALFVSDLLTSPLFTDVKVDEITSFSPGNESTEGVSDDFEEIPRYSTLFTLDINSSNLQYKGETR